MTGRKSAPSFEGGHEKYRGKELEGLLFRGANGRKKLDAPTSSPIVTQKGAE